MALIPGYAQPDAIVSVQESTDVSSARRVIASRASKAGFSEEEAGKAALIATEAASNLIKHGSGGEVIVRHLSGTGRGVLEIIAIDRGRGMSNIARCFEDGYSTGGSPGTGLGAIARLSTFHDIYSVVEKGTVLLARIGNEAHSDEKLLTGAVNVPYPGEEVCGDAWTFHIGAERTRFIVADGLGHGVFAAEASRSAIQSIGDARYPQPADVIEDAHLRLKATRGAAVAVVDVNFRTGIANFAGVGNVAGAIITDRGVKRQMVSMNGTLGHQMGRSRQFEYPFEADSLLILHSDGLSANWSLDKYPGLHLRHPSVIAGVLFRDFRRVRDDATVVVARRKGHAE